MSDLEFLNARRSVPSRQLGEPGPTAAQLDALLRASLRVPDHGKLAPWRLLLIRGEARARFGAALVDIHRRADPAAPDSVVEKDRDRYNFAPLIVAVVARIDVAHAKIPAQEQLLSAGYVAYNLMLGAQELGFGAQLLTGWAAYNSDVAKLLGLVQGESLIGFVHIGSVQEPAPERTRPALDTVVSEWNG
jgi:nitroreductase